MVCCWGRKQYGQIADATSIQRPTPVQAIGISGLGDATVTNRVQPVTEINLAGVVQSLALGAQSACVVMTSGTGKCWGGNVNGQLGNGTINLNWSRPEDISQWLRDDLIFRDDFDP